MARDSDIPFERLHKRDRKIALELTEKNIQEPDRQLEGWLSKLITEEDKMLWAQVESGHRLIGFGMIVVGLLVGWLTVAGLLQYDGAGRVNLVYLLFVFVALQLALVLLAVIAMLPASISRWLPGFSSFQEMLKWFSPGRLQRLISRFMPKSEQSEIAQLLGRNQKIFAGIGKWQVFSWSQLFGVAFNIAALITLFVLIAVKDIAFGWSTTLNIQAETILGITNFLSWPWQSWMSNEVPSQSLVEASRYFRLQELAPTAVDPALLGQWWPFLMLCLLFYGLLPRIILLIFCRFELAGAIDRTIRYFPGREALFDRLNMAMVETQASRGNDFSIVADEQFEKRDCIAQPVTGSPVIIVNWSQFELTDKLLLEEVSRIGQFLVEASYKAGTNCQPEEDLQVIETVSRSDSNRPVVVLVKSWEPPLGELADFLQDLREAIAPERSVRLMPIAVKSGRLATPEQRDIDEWRRFAASLADPWLSLLMIETGLNFESNDE